MNPLEVAWLAGLVEGEGCFMFTGKNSVQLQIGMTDLDVLQRCLEVTGVGSIRGPYRTGHELHSPYWSWAVSRQEDLRPIVEAILPLLGERRSKRAEESLRRMDKLRKRGYCKHGHPMAGDNLYVGPHGERQCRACRKVRDANRKR